MGWYRGVDFDLEASSLLESLDNARKENDIQKYIKENKKWFIPASLFEDYDFGHHEAYIVPEQRLGAEYQVDYMLLGRNSIGYLSIISLCIKITRMEMVIASILQLRKRNQESVSSQ